MGTGRWRRGCECFRDVILTSFLSKLALAAIMLIKCDLAPRAEQQPFISTQVDHQRRLK